MPTFSQTLDVLLKYLYKALMSTHTHTFKQTHPQTQMYSVFTDQHAKVQEREQLLALQPPHEKPTIPQRNFNCVTVPSQVYSWLQVVWTVKS